MLGIASIPEATPQTEAHLKAEAFEITRWHHFGHPDSTFDAIQPAASARPAKHSCVAAGRRVVSGADPEHAVLAKDRGHDVLGRGTREHPRSAERRVGKEWVRTCRARGAPYH